MSNSIQLDPKDFLQKKIGKAIRGIKKLPTGESSKEDKNLKDSIAELYLKLKRRALQANDQNDDKEILISMTSSVIIGYINTFFEIILSQLDAA